MVELVKGQNTVIDECLAYQVSVQNQGWDLGILLGGESGFKTLESDAGVSLSSDALFINISDIDPSINMVVLYAQRTEQSSPSIDCCLLSSLTGQVIAQCKSGSIETNLSAIELIHIYKVNGKWKIKSYFQGYAAGQQGLMASRKVNLGNVEPKPIEHASSLSKLNFTLKWIPSCATSFDTSQAYIGSGSLSISTLNLSCLYVLKSGQRGLIHGGDEAGDRGSDHGIPFARIINDYDAGKCSLVFNTKYAHKMYKYVVCAEISEGSRCWEDVKANLACCNNDQTKNQVIDSPLHTPIYVYAVLEIVDGTLREKIVNQYFTSYQDIAAVSGFSNA